MYGTKQQLQTVAGSAVSSGEIAEVPLPDGTTMLALIDDDMVTVDQSAEKVTYSGDKELTFPEIKGTLQLLIGANNVEQHMDSERHRLADGRYVRQYPLGWTLWGAKTETSRQPVVCLPIVKNRLKAQSPLTPHRGASHFQINKSIRTVNTGFHRTTVIVRILDFRGAISTCELFRNTLISFLMISR